MKEILFRAKSKYRNPSRWAFGLYTCSDDTYFMQVNNNLRVIIKPETIGQYTGLIDVDGDKIFDGDILEAHLDDDDPDYATRVLVTWEDYSWVLQQIPDDCEADPVEDDDNGRWKIIGNRWDDPELLKGDDEE